MRVAILDDEPLILEQMKYILSQFSEIELVWESTSSLDTLEHLDDFTPDIIFSDISMPELNGLEFAERVWEKDSDIRIVFITAFHDYAIEAYRVNTIDYITKPVTTQKIKRTLEKINKLGMAAVKQEPDDAVNCFIGRKGEKYYIIEPRDGCFIKVVARSVLLVTEKDTYQLNHTIGYWENRLKQSGWLRCHKSYVVNVYQIKEIYPMFNGTYNVRTKGSDEEIPISRTYVKTVKSVLGM